MHVLGYIIIRYVSCHMRYDVCEKIDEVSLELNVKWEVPRMWYVSRLCVSMLFFRAVTPCDHAGIFRSFGVIHCLIFRTKTQTYVLPKRRCLPVSPRASQLIKPQSTGTEGAEINRYEPKLCSPDYFLYQQKVGSFIKATYSRSLCERHEKCAPNVTGKSETQT
jgi:hypothetical protein